MKKIDQQMNHLDWGGNPRPPPPPLKKEVYHTQTTRLERQFRLVARKAHKCI